SGTMSMLPADVCVTADEVAAFLGGRLDAAAAQALEAHIARCAECRQLLSAVARTATPGSAHLASLAATFADSPEAVDGGVADALPEGATVGRYVVLGQLGAGGMGVVYAARDPELDRKVALKLLRTDRVSPDTQRPLQDRLLREAQAMGQLAHPNVVAVYDVGRFGNQVFVAMELVEGQTLAHWINEQPRHFREVLATFIAAGQGLSAAHAAGLVHRDFKPENVLMG